MNVLVVNAGSSTLKYQVIDTKSHKVSAKGSCERVCFTGGTFTHAANGSKKVTENIEFPDHKVAIEVVLKDLEANGVKIEGIGHRIVQGGWYFGDSSLVDEDVLAKLGEIDSGDEGDTDGGDTTPTADQVDAGQVAELAAAATKLGLSVIDPGTLAEMQRNSSLGAKAHAQMETQRITAAVDAAISLGKITPARKEHFVSLMRADEVGTTQLLAGIPAYTAVPMNELGHALEPQAFAGGDQGGDVTESPTYKAWSVE